MPGLDKLFRVLDSNTFRAWALRILAGLLIATRYRRRAPHDDRLNRGYSPIFLLLDISLTALTFTGFQRLRVQTPWGTARPHPARYARESAG